MHFAPVQATLDVPEGDFLLAWAADPHRRHAASLVFKDAAGGAARETLVLKAAFCVRYQEEFVAGDTAAGAYVCHLELSDPDGFTMQAGGPAGAFVAPMAREHGVPGVAAVAASTKAKLIAGTPEHKQDRWARYQVKKAGNPKAWDYARWERQYDTNMRNVSFGLAREQEYCQA